MKFVYIIAIAQGIVRQKIFYFPAAHGTPSSLLERVAWDNDGIKTITVKKVRNNLVCLNTICFLV